MSTYINTKTKIKLQNIKTEVIGYMIFSNFQRGNRFDNHNEKLKLTQEEVSSYCVSHGYYLRSQYVNSYTKIKLENIKTGAIGYMTFNSFQQGCRFDRYRGGIKLTYQEYIQPFVNEGYQVDITEDEYNNVNSRTKVDVICSNGHKWSIARRTFTSSHQYCPICNQSGLGSMSNGERLIYSILSGNGIDFKREISIDINGKTHRFDFYLKLNNKKYFIEYDGIQHYKESTGYLKGKLAEQQRKDKIKDQYALDNNIHMVRIPYTENTVGKVVKMMNDKMEVTLHKVKVDLPKRQEILDYYLNHGMEETADRFGIGILTVYKYARDTWGMSKEKYFVKIGKKVSSKEMADYYLKHNLKETKNKFEVSNTTIRNYFKKEYGMSRRDYLKTLDMGSFLCYTIFIVNKKKRNMLCKELNLLALTKQNNE